MRAPLSVIYPLTFFGSVAGGTFWAIIFFVAARVHDFSPLRNLVLAVAMGIVYVVGAMRSGAIQRRAAAFASPRALCGAVLALLFLASLASLLFFAHEAVLWGCGLLASFALSILWPVVEAYLGAARHGAELRRHVGGFNTVWSAAVPVPLLLIPLVGARNIAWAFGMTAVTTLISFLYTRRLPRDLPAHDRTTSAAGHGPEYPQLLRTALWLLPLSYVCSSTLGPLLPHQLEQIGVGPGTETAVAGTWMVVRSLTLFALTHWHFWYGRWGPLFFGWAALCLGLSGVLIAPNLVTVMCALALFGIAMGLIYTAGLYYSLAVGHAEVDAGGRFEGLIGTGYIVGPLVGMAGSAAGGGVATALLLLGVGALYGLAALRPYLRVREQRRDRAAAAASSWRGNVS